MDLFCPHCTRRVSVPDDQAGQAVACPLCAKQFMTPSLAPPPVAPKPAPPVPKETYGMGPAPAAPASPKPATPPGSSLAPTRPEPAPAPPPAPPPGEYSRSCSCTLTGAWVAILPTVCLVLIFLLSFFTWHAPVLDPESLKISADQSEKEVKKMIRDKTSPALSLWGLSFSEKGQGQFLAYTILMFPTFLLAVIVMLFDKGLLPTPPQMVSLSKWKNLLLALALGLTFFLLAFDYLNGQFVVETASPIAFAMKLAIRLHFLAMFASFVMFWLHWRKSNNLPLPKCEMRW